MVKTNIKQVQAFFKKFPEKVEEAFSKGAYTGMVVFQGKFTREQLSGRKGNIGLNRISSNLANSFLVYKPSKDIIKFGASSKYAHVHAHENGFNGIIKPVRAKYLCFKTKNGNFVQAKQVYIPKRLYFYESYIKYGKEMIVKGFSKELYKTINKGK